MTRSFNFFSFNHQIKWRKTHHYHQLSDPCTLVLASTDVSGVIHIWNIVQGSVIATLQDGNRQVSGKEEGKTITKGTLFTTLF